MYNANAKMIVRKERKTKDNIWLITIIFSMCKILIKNKKNPYGVFYFTLDFKEL